MTEQQKAFIDKIAPLVQKYAAEYDIAVCSPIIAQAIQESGWGKSKLSKQYHNYFGMKCGSKWRGKSVNMTTTEEYTAGTTTVIKDNFRAYDSVEEGIKGYFDFIQLARHEKARKATTPRAYIEELKAAGYATESAYVSDIMNLIEKYNLTQYDTVKKEVQEMTDKDIKICGHGSGRPSIKNLHDYAENRYNQRAANGKRKGIVCVKRHKNITAALEQAFVDNYNIIIGRNYYSQVLRAYVYKKHPSGRYYSDCSSSGMATMNRIGMKTGGLLSTAGIYWSNYFEDVKVKILNGHITNPEVLQVGDAILFRGSDSSRPLQIGHVEYVYQIPKYKKETTTKKKTTIPKSATIVVGEVIEGEWGSGEERKKRLTEAGYDYDLIQKKVNSTLKAKKSLEDIAQDVISGKYGSGQDRVKALKAAGYDADAVQNKVNELLGFKKVYAQIAAEVIAGKWGNGEARKTKLKQAGYTEDQIKKIQQEVNKQLKQ